MLEKHGVRVSMDGKGRYTDNIFVERLWRTVKYEGVYLKAYSNGREAKAGIDDYFRFYIIQRLQSGSGFNPALGYRTPAEVFNSMGVKANQPKRHQRGVGHPAERWNPTQQRWDPHLI